MRRVPTCLAIVLTLACGAGAVDAAPSETPKAPQVIEGEIVDPATYLKTGRSGPELADQTYEAVDGGQTLALLETTTSTLYLLLAEEAGEDPNELAYDYVNHHVKATGTVYEHGGVRGLVATSILPLDAAAEGTAAPSQLAPTPAITPTPSSSSPR